MTFATVDGHNVTSAKVRVAGVGPWFADVDLEGEPELAEQVTLRLGALELVGTPAARYSGRFGLQRRVCIVAGAGGWGTLLEPKAYHNDAGIRARTIAEDAARAAGEVLGGFVPTEERMGIDYVRQAGPASRVIDDVIGAASSWWVDYAGVTHVGSRGTVEVDAGVYEVLDYDPRARLVTVAVDDPSAIGVGSVLSERLEEPQTVRELELVVMPEGVRVLAWCGGEGATGRLVAAIRGIVERLTDAKLVGSFRYRVVSTSGDRLQLQVVRRRAGLPDILPISVWPGVAGAHVTPTPGTEVLVEFVEGDRAQPIVTAWASKAGPGFTPVKVALNATGQVELGGEGLTPVLDGVVTGQGIDTFTGATYAALGATSSLVSAKKLPGGP